MTEHTVEESLEAIVRMLSSIEDLLIPIANYFREKGENEFGHRMD